MKKFDERLTDEKDRKEMVKVYLGKLNSCDAFWLFIRDCCGCFPENVLHSPNMVNRWYVIGKKRLEEELNLVKILKTLRNVKVL